MCQEVVGCRVGWLVGALRVTKGKSWKSCCWVRGCSSAQRMHNMCVCEFVQASMCGKGLVLCVCSSLCFSGEVCNPYAKHLKIQWCPKAFCFGIQWCLMHHAEKATPRSADVIVISVWVGKRRALQQAHCWSVEWGGASFGAATAQSFTCLIKETVDRQGCCLKKLFCQSPFLCSLLFTRSNHLPNEAL